LLVLIEQCAFFAFLAAVFARSLRPDRVPLCTRWADLLHGPLAPPEYRYTRTLTAFWAALFGFLVLSSLVLFALAPRTVWSAYVNFAVPLIIIGTFIVEYGIRLRVLPATAHADILAGVRLFRAALRTPPAASRG
jgi:uncharacterized membrane protein